MKTFASSSLALMLSTTAAFFGYQTYSNYQLGAPDISKGKAYYLSHCAVCHGSKGLGDGPVSETLTIKPDNIYSELLYPFAFRTELIGSVLDGDNGQGGLMPAFKGTLTEQQVNDIFGYIESINELPHSPSIN